MRPYWAAAGILTSQIHHRSINIHAALHPKDGDSLYFVARGDGSHVFSKSLDEHNQAVRDFQLKRRADYRSSPAPQTSETKETP